MHKYLALFFYLLALAGAFPTFTEVGPNARARSFSYSGNGCPQGSAALAINENGTSTVFEEMQPSVGPAVPAAQRTKTCTVTLDMTVDAGWKYRVNGLGTVFQGVMPVEKGWSLDVTAKYTFKNDATQSSATINFVGPLTGNPLSGRGNPSPAGGIMSPCGGGVVSAAYSTSFTTSSNGGTSPPIDSDLSWYIHTSVEWLKC